MTSPRVTKIIAPRPWSPWSLTCFIICNPQMTTSDTNLEELDEFGNSADESGNEQNQIGREMSMEDGIGGPATENHASGFHIAPTTGILAAAPTMRSSITETSPLNAIALNTPGISLPPHALDHSPDVFQPLLARTHSINDTGSSSHKKLKRSSSPSSDSPELDDRNQCSICLEPWSSSGPHRIVSIKCGHLFGDSCIQKWFKTAKKDKCPECNEMGCKRDIRVIWAKSIVAVDTSELESARRELTQERSARHEVEAEKAKLQIACRLEMTRMEREINDMRRLNSTLALQIEEYRAISKHWPRGQSTNSRSYELSCLLTISTEPQAARVMLFNPHHEMLIVGKSRLGLGSGTAGTAGLLKISLREMSSQEYVPIHCKSIRDAQCCPTGNGLILTTSLDKTLKLTSTVGCNSTVQSFELERPGWSCCWKNDDTNYMFCGLANSTVLMFDIRSTKGPVSRLQHGSGKPIHSMAYIARSNDALVSGLVVGSFDSVFLWNAAGDGDVGLHENSEITQHSEFDLQVSGASCYSVSYDQMTQQILASFRSASFTRHVVAVPTTSNDGLPALYQTRAHDGKSGQNSLARTFIFSRKEPNEIKTYVCSGDEDSCSLSIWGPEGEVQQLERQVDWEKECVLDVKRCIQSSGKDIIAGLTERHVRLYSYQ